MLEQYRTNIKKYRTKNGRLMLLSKCAICGKIPRFMKEQEAKGLSNLGIITPPSKTPILYDILS